MAEYLLGIDAGTESIRTGVFVILRDVRSSAEAKFIEFIDNPARE